MTHYTRCQGWIVWGNQTSEWNDRERRTAELDRKSAGKASGLIRNCRQGSGKNSTGAQDAILLPDRSELLSRVATDRIRQANHRSRGYHIVYRIPSAIIHK